MLDVQAITGMERSTLDPKKSVFINCPFDQSYKRLHNAIIFAVVSCGFIPRCADDFCTMAELRMERITHAIFSSKYSIHDLSRCKGEGEEGYARFNMPLELGIAMAHRHITRGQLIQHEWYVLVPKGHVYPRYVSDLAGYDLEEHDNKVRTVVRNVINWLLAKPDVVFHVSPKEVLDAWPSFEKELALLRGNHGPKPPWKKIIEAAEEMAPKTLHVSRR
jgi:hypothetical protein